MKVAQLKQAIADLPDNAEVLLSANGGHPVWWDDTILPGIRGRVIHQRLWGDKYQTRKAYNAYGCIDDRYGGRVFLIEVGQLSE